MNECVICGAAIKTVAIDGTSRGVDCSCIILISDEPDGVATVVNQDIDGIRLLQFDNGIDGGPSDCVFLTSIPEALAVSEYLRTWARKASKVKP